VIFSVLSANEKKALPFCPHGSKANNWKVKPYVKQIQTKQTKTDMNRDFNVLIHISNRFEV
jgi:hypothetical protein